MNASMPETEGPKPSFNLGEMQPKAGVQRDVPCMLEPYLKHLQLARPKSLALSDTTHRPFSHSPSQVKVTACFTHIHWSNHLARDQT